MQKHGVPSWIGPKSVGELLRRPIVFVGSLLRSPVWAAGLVVTLVAMAMETQALGDGDVSVVKPLSRVQSVFVLLIAVGILRERLQPIEWIGVVTLTLGAVMLAREPADSLLFAPSSSASLAAAAGVALGVFLLVAITDRVAGPARGELGLGVAAGLLFGLGDVLMKIGTETARDAGGRFDLASTEGFHSLLGAFEFHLSVGFTAGAFLLQQAAFSRGRVSLVAPMIGASGTLVVLLLGAYLLREPLGATRLLAVGVMTTGTLLLSMPSAGRARLRRAEETSRARGES